MKKQNSVAARFLIAGTAAIFLLVPFHAFFTAWFASNFGYFDAVRLWKEALLMLLSIAAAIVVMRDDVLWAKLKTDRLVQLVCLMLLLTLLMTFSGIMARRVGFEAAVYGAVIDSRYLIFLLITIIAAHKLPKDTKWLRWILWPAAAVGIFGLLQLLVLPNDFLRHFGYGDATLPAYQAVDNKEDFARIQSTLRGPNPLGAYLVPVLALAGSAALFFKRQQRVILGFFIVGLAVLFGSYSRSAWIGLFVTAVSFLYLSARTNQHKKALYITLGIFIVIGASAVYILRHNDTFQNLVFHTNELSASPESSNAQRFTGLKQGAQAVLSDPFGKGVGSAGPASLRNDKAMASINENFFLQIGQEMGMVGIALLIGILVVIGYKLWQRRDEGVPRALLASLLGLIVVNLVSHAWADDTLAYVFFGAVGFAIYTKKSTKSEKRATL